MYRPVRWLYRYSQFGAKIAAPDLRRDVGIGRRLCEALEAIARDAGDERIVVSATPSEHTVTFYRRRGYEVMAEPLEELFAREPDDIHLEKSL